MSQHTRRMSRVVAPAIAGLLVATASAFSPHAIAANAAASTRIIQSPTDRSTGDSSTGAVVFAEDSFTSSPQTVLVRASAGNGSLTTFASAFSGPVNGTLAGGAATASLTDRIVVGLDGTVVNPVLPDFAIHASGDARFSHGGLTNFGSASAKVAYSFSVTDNGLPVTTLAGSVERGLRVDIAGSTACQCVLKKEYEIFEGPPLIDFKLTLEAKAGAPSFFDVAISSRSSASASPGLVGTTSATADFGRTFTWLGLERAYFSDGTPYTGALSITSTSGFDYGRAITPVPEPETYAMLLAGLGLIAWRSARRGSRSGAG